MHYRAARECLRANVLIPIAMELCEVFVVLLLPQAAATASFSCQYMAQIHLRGGLGGLQPC